MNRFWIKVMCLSLAVAFVSALATKKQRLVSREQRSSKVWSWPFPTGYHAAGNALSIGTDRFDSMVLMPMASTGGSKTFVIHGATGKSVNLTIPYATTEAALSFKRDRSPFTQAIAIRIPGSNMWKAYNPITGAEYWTRANLTEGKMIASTGPNGSPSFTFMNQDGQIESIDAFSGLTIWNKTVTWSNPNDLTVYDFVYAYDHVAVLVGFAGNVIALESDDGDIAWNSTVFIDPEVTRHTIVATINSPHVAVMSEQNDEWFIFNIHTGNVTSKQIEGEPWAIYGIDEGFALNCPPNIIMAYSAKGHSLWSAYHFWDAMTNVGPCDGGVCWVGENASGNYLHRNAGGNMTYNITSPAPEFITHGPGGSFLGYDDHVDCVSLE